MNKGTIILSIKSLSPLFIVRVVVLLVFVLVIFIIRGQINSLAKKTSLTLANISIQTSLIGQAAELKQQYNDYYPMLSKINALLPGPDNLPNFVSAVENAGEKARMDFTTIKFGGEPITSATVVGVKEIAISMNAGGTASKFADLFEELSSMPYFMNLTNISIDAQGGLEGTALLQASGTLFLK